jgi:hypothetical protein
MKHSERERERERREIMNIFLFICGLFSDNVMSVAKNNENRRETA